MLFQESETIELKEVVVDDIKKEIVSVFHKKAFFYLVFAFLVKVPNLLYTYRITLHMIFRQ